jgi:hypothetical protein
MAPKMSIPRSILPHGRSDVLIRLLWLVLAAIHIAPMLRLGSVAIAGDLAAGRWISLVALTASLAFFALKTAGAPFLRLPAKANRGTALVLFLVACGLLHGNAKPQDWLEKTGYTAIAVAAAAGATTMASGRLRKRIGEFLKRARGGLSSSGVSAVLESLSGSVEQRVSLCWRGVLVACHAPPRAPPFMAGLRA